MKLNFAEIEIVDLDGVSHQIENIHKPLANVLWKAADTIEEDKRAEAIHSGEVVEVTEDEFAVIFEILKARPYYKRWIHKQIMAWLEEKMISLNINP